MPDLRFEKTETTEQFKALLDAENAPLPWIEGEDGAIFDANGNIVLQVDPVDERPDQNTFAIAVWVVTALNTCGGFKAVPSPNEEKTDG